jgi:hypothetical protein
MLIELQIHVHNIAGDKGDWTHAMNRLMVLLVVVIASHLTSACATRSLTVTYLSDPPGAALYQDSQLLGYTPLSLRYTVTDDEMRMGRKVLKGTSAKWASGASAGVSHANADIGQHGLNQSFTFRRPDTEPGRDLDVQVGLEKERLSITERQMQNQRRQYEQQREDYLYESCMNRAKNAFDKASCMNERGGRGIGRMLSQ